MQPLSNGSRRSKEVIGPESYIRVREVCGAGFRGEHARASERGRKEREREEVGVQNKGLLKIAHSAALWSL